MTPFQESVIWGFVALAAVCVWAARSSHRVNPWAVVILLWVINNLAFYLVYKYIHHGVLNEMLINWSVFTRWHSIILAGGSLIIAVRKGRRRDD